MLHKITLSLCLLAVFLVTSCQDHLVTAPTDPTFTVSTLATGLTAAISVETDALGHVFVAEQGTGHNDGSISEITPDGARHPIVTNIYSMTNTEGDLDAVDHMLVVGKTLYFLNPKGLYTFDLTSYVTGLAPILASSLTPQDIRSFVIAYKFTNDNNESHPYNLGIGPDGSLYIADAAANAIIRRSTTGVLSVVAEVPGIANPLPTPPSPPIPFLDAVPTSIVFDGHNFLISTLIGFPFPPGSAIVYKMDLSGNLTKYQSTFNSLSDVENDGNGKPLVLELGAGPFGFAPNSGRLLRANGTSSTVLLSGLNMPTDLKIVNTHTAYITSLGTTPGTGSLLKVSF